FGVLPLERVEVVGRLRRRDLVAARDDGAALHLVRVVQCAPIVGVAREVAGREHLDDARGSEQCEEHEGDDDAQSPDLLGHQPITALGCLRTASLTRRRIATMSQLATREDPPAARNGVVRPVRGITRVTPPTMMKTCSASVKARPTDSSLPK